MQLSTNLGRSVKVIPGQGFASALGQLDKILNQNRVRYTLFKTDRHEKKGEKRRRIKSEQWRKHFANQVRALIWQSHFLNPPS